MARSNKIRYYKAMMTKGKKWYAESWGDRLNVTLPSGTKLTLACEFVRGDGWRVTDTASGYIAHNNNIPNKTALKEYYKKEDVLAALERIVVSAYYQKSIKELNEYAAQFA